MPNHHLLLLLLMLMLAAAVGAAGQGRSVDGDADGVDMVNSISTLAPGAQLQPRNLVKRAPASSFVGMRGKKKQEASADTNWLGPDPMDYGDDDTDNYYNENGRRFKKAPLAFVGVRGKKFTSSNNRLHDLLQHLEEQRLQEGILEEFLEHLAVDGPDMAKRAPTGFTGMRGKRPNFSDGDVAENDEDALELLEKRAPVNSFVGVRGKKDVSHQHYKREALSELWRKLFKKAYDVRGKKQRFADFNNKFVAVRGKKSDSEDGNGLDENPPQHWLYVIGDKRAPSGFLGMRGKRPALEQ